jgi:hypothetical protein
MNIPDEVKKLREQIMWKYQDRKAIRIDPPLPQPEKDEDLQEVRLAI